MQGRRRAILLTLLALAALLSASMLAPAFGAPKAVSAVSLAKKLTRTTKIAKRADRNAKRAIAGLQHVSGGTTGAQGPAGPRVTRATRAFPARPPARATPARRARRATREPPGPPALPALPARRATRATRASRAIPRAAARRAIPARTASPARRSAGSVGAAHRRVGQQRVAERPAVVGNFTLRFVCSGDAAHRLFTLGVPAGSGGIQLSGIKTISDTAGSTVPFAAGAALPAGQFVGIGVGQPNPNNTSGLFYRMNGSFVLHNGLTVTTVTYDMFLETAATRARASSAAPPSNPA